MSRAPTLWTTMRDFTIVAVACAAGAAALSALALPAHAEGLPPPRFAYADAPAWAACRPDVLRHCPNVVPGG